MGFLKALALFVSSYLVDPNSTVSALKSIGKKEVILQKQEISLPELKPITAEKAEILSKTPDNKLPELEKVFKSSYKNHANAARLGLTVTYLECKSLKSHDRTLRGVKEIESFIKEAKDAKYIVL